MNFKINQMERTGKMNDVDLGILHVTTTKKPPYRSKVTMRSPRLADLGFTCGTPVFAVPQHDGFTLSLRDENGKNGKWIHTGIDGNKLVIYLNFSKNFSPAGLSTGDFLVAEYDYGIINAKKLPDAQRYYIVGSRDYEAHLLMTGDWLHNAGFSFGVVTIVSAINETITLNVWNNAAASYGEIVKFSRARKEQIIQPQKNQHVTTIYIPGFILKNAGFCKGDVTGVRYEYGTMKLFKPDLKKLGF